MDESLPKEEPLLKNETQLDRRLVNESITAYRKVFNGSSHVFWMVIAAIPLLLGLYLIIFSKVYIPAYILFALCACLLLVTFWPRNTGKFYRSAQAVNPGGKYSFAFFADRFEQATPVSGASFSYANVTKVIETKSAYTLIFVTSPVIVGKANFQKNTTQDTEEFLRQKCANARFYKKF